MKLRHFPLLFVFLLGISPALQAHIEYYDLNQGAQINDLSGQGKTASTNQYGATPGSVIALGNNPANGLGVIVSQVDLPLNNPKFWNPNYQAYTGVGQFSNLSFDPVTGAGMATVDVDDVTDFGWGDGTTALLGNSHKVDFFNFRLYRPAIVTLSWNVNLGSDYVDCGFTLYRGFLPYQGHDDGAEKLNPMVSNIEVQDRLDDVNAPLDAQGIASSYRNTKSSGPGIYPGQFNALANWGQANTAGNWSNVAYIVHVNNNPGSSAGSSTNPDDTLESLTLALEPGNYTVAASGALNASPAAGGFGVSSYGTTGMHGRLTYQAIVQSANAIATSTSLSSDVNPADLGSEVILSALVSGNAPAGTVRFSDGATTLGTAALIGGQADFTTSNLGAGTHVITATYLGDTNNLASTSNTLSQLISQNSGQQNSATALSASRVASRFGQPVYFGVTVSGNRPRGTVTFREGRADLLTVPLRKQISRARLSTLQAGSHRIVAAYSGDANNSASTSSPLQYSVSRYSTRTSLAAKPRTVDAEAPLSLTAKVKGKLAGGSVSFWVDGAQWGESVELRANKAKLVISDLPAGEHDITANYSGDSNNTASVSKALRVRVR